MTRRKGELTASGIDRGWPHQIARPADLGKGADYNIIREFCRDLSLCERGHSVFHEDQWWNVYCFAEKEHAEKFLERFGGEWFDPTQKGRGHSWARWKKG